MNLLGAHQAATLREHIAIRAMEAIIANPSWTEHLQKPTPGMTKTEFIAYSAFAIADAMMTEKTESLKNNDKPIEVDCNDIYQLCLSTRTEKWLVTNGILSIKDLCKHSKRSLLKLSGIGYQSVKEIEEVLEQNGLKLSKTNLHLSRQRLINKLTDMKRHYEGDEVLESTIKFLEEV
jgi:DNA-directed RNA polymerase alpha subunit